MEGDPTQQTAHTPVTLIPQATEDGRPYKNTCLTPTTTDTRSFFRRSENFQKIATKN